MKFPHGLSRRAAIGSLPAEGCFLWRIKEATADLGGKEVVLGARHWKMGMTKETLRGILKKMRRLWSCLYNPAKRPVL